jgi:pimeloyl-ACP methyl ester carboxylesterase
MKQNTAAATSSSRSAAVQHFTLVLLLGLALLSPTGNAVAAPTGPPLTEPPAALAAATSCDPTAQLQAAPEVVLLVHGTATTVKESWDWSYVRALHGDGFALCTVTLPDFGLGSVTRAAEYVVAAARTAIERSGKRISIIGHSQGGQLAAWVTRFWPDVAEGVHDVVALASPFDGTQLGNQLCALKRCAALAWQSRRGSNTVAALRQAPVPAGVDTTSIATRYDEIVYPQPAVSRLPGARDILLQNVCRNDPVEHNLILGDPLAYALAIDAITHAGPADPARIPASTCQQLLIPHGDPVGATAGLGSILRFFTGILDPRRFVSAEPPLPEYAR